MLAPFGEAGEHRSEGDPRPLHDGLAADDARVPDDPLLVVHRAPIIALAQATTPHAGPACHGGFRSRIGPITPKHRPKSRITKHQQATCARHTIVITCPTPSWSTAGTVTA